MDQDPATPMHDPGNVVPLRIAGELPLSFEELVEQSLRIGLGLAVLSVDTLGEGVARTIGNDVPRTGGRADGSATPSLPLVAGAAFGLTVGVARWGARAATTLVRTGELALSPVTTSVPFRDGMRRLGAELGRLDARWRSERPQEEEAAQALVRLLVPQVVDAALDQMDLNKIVAERVDIAEIIERVDLNAAVARVDLDAILERVNVDDIVAHVDLDRVVDRIDVDAVAAKLDVEAIVRKLDLAAIAREVVDELDLPEIIREAMGSMTTETVGGIRVQSMNADHAISRLVDRVLRRRAASEGPPPEDRTEDQA